MLMDARTPFSGLVNKHTNGRTSKPLRSSLKIATMDYATAYCIVAVQGAPGAHPKLI
jgi:hypothetical protein